MKRLLNTLANIAVSLQSLVNESGSIRNDLARLVTVMDSRTAAEIKMERDLADANKKIEVLIETVSTYGYPNGHRGDCLDEYDSWKRAIEHVTDGKHGTFFRFKIMQLPDPVEIRAGVDTVELLKNTLSSIEGTQADVVVNKKGKK